jgi:hypothetical protein
MARDPDVFNAESRPPNSTPALAVARRNPTYPLRRLDLGTFAGHCIVNVLVRTGRRHWIGDINLLAINEHGHPTILGELSTKVRLSTTIFLAHASTSVTATLVVGPSVPSCLRDTVPVVLHNVHLHTGWLSLTLNVTIIAGTEVAWVGRD